MKNKLRFAPFWVALGLLAPFFGQAQEMPLAQFYNARAAMNPAFVAVAQGSEIALSHRWQWAGLQRGLHLTEANLSNRLCGWRLATGLRLARATEPTFGFRSTEAAFRLAGFLGGDQKMGKKGLKDQRNWSLNIGAEGQFSQRTTRAEGLLFSGDLNPFAPPTDFSSGSPAGGFEPLQNFTLGGGAVFRADLTLFKRKKPFPLVVGAALRHAFGDRDGSFFGAPDQSLFGRRATLHGAFSVPVTRDLGKNWLGYATPFFRFDFTGPNLRRGTGGLMFQPIQKIRLGATASFHRTAPTGGQNARSVGLFFGAKWQNAPFSITYHADFTPSGLAGRTAHEVAMVFDFEKACLRTRQKCQTCGCPKLGGAGFWE